MSILSELSSAFFYTDAGTKNILAPYILAQRTNPSTLKEVSENQPTPFATFNQTVNKQIEVNIFDVLYDKNEIEKNSIFVINLEGPIMKNRNWWNIGTNFITKALEIADNVDNVICHVIKISSGGGNGYASESLAKTIKSLKKPVFAYYDDILASAAYHFATACAHIRCGSNSALVGSIGTYIPFWDDSKMLEKLGIVELEIYARKSSDKNEISRQIIESDFKDTSKGTDLADAFNEFFLKDIKVNRKGKLKTTEEAWGTGKTFFTKEALEIGLIDDIGPFNQYLNDITKAFATN